MRKELDDALVRDFPELYVQRHGDVRTTCMCWGFDCGDGWEPIIRKLSEQLDYLAKGKIQATQVKEKFGTLRFYEAGPYANDSTLADIVQACISYACRRSGATCEECGANAYMKYSGGSPYGWMKTICDKCAVGTSYGDVTDGGDD